MMHPSFLHSNLMLMYHIRLQASCSQSAPSTSSSSVGGVGQVVDAAISESVFNMLESCVAEMAVAGYDRPPSGSTISGKDESLADNTSHKPTLWYTRRLLDQSDVLCTRLPRTVFRTL